MTQVVTTTDKLLHEPPGTTCVMFNSVRGVAIRADVRPPYDSFGVTVRPRGPIRSEMMDTVEAWVGDLQRLSHRDLEVITLCSVWRPAKPGEVINRHAEGRAIDIGGVWFNRLDGLTAWGYSKRRREAVGLECSMRIHFGTVLGPTANQAHANHWHVDIGKDVALTADELEAARRVRKVEVAFLQDQLNTLHGYTLAMDGYWGPKTEAATKSVLEQLGHDDITEVSAYRALLRAGVYVGFGVVESPG